MLGKGWLDKGRRGHRSANRLEKVQANACFLGLERGREEGELGRAHRALGQVAVNLQVQVTVSPDGSKERLTALEI